MGNKVGLNERNKSKFTLENELGHQIIKLKAAEPTPIEILDMGIFEHGEFIHVSHLNAKYYMNDNQLRLIESNEKLRDTTLVYEKSKDNTNFKIHVRGCISEEYNLSHLEKCLNNANINKSLFKKYKLKTIYVVQKVYKSHFVIFVCSA